MQRLNSVSVESAEGHAKQLFNDVQQAFGVVPNAVKVMANSPAVLESYLVFSQAMGGASLGDKLHNQVKLTTSESNSCEYCASILSAFGREAGMTEEEILSGRTASAEDQRTDAALKFARSVLEHHGKVNNEDLDAVREAGFGDTEIVEIVASVILGCFTNFLNNVADTELDIPRAEPVEACSTGSGCSCSA